MKILLFFLLFTISSMANVAFTQNISIPGPYHWQNRIVLIFASEDDPMLEKQLKLFEENQAGMDERDLIVFRILHDQVIQTVGSTYDEKSARKLRSQYHVAEGEFSVTLIGKDGSKKLQQQEILSIDKLFATIDAMPMRRREMRNSDGD